MPRAERGFTILRWLPMSPNDDSITGLDIALRERHDAAYFLRILLGFCVGGMATWFMAWFMDYLITSSEILLKESERVQMLDFVRVKQQESVRRRDRTPERPQLTNAPEAPPMPQSQGQSEAVGQQLQVSAMELPQNSVEIKGSTGFASGEGDYLPILKVAPVYPRWALERGITGNCVVSYTVTTAGTVKDVKVLEDQCDSKIFYGPSVDAALRFKYKPRVIDGVPIEVRGVRNVFRYLGVAKE